MRELLASRATLLVALVTGPLVGQAFITAVRTYAEMSGSAGQGALSQGLSPLDGIVVPTFGAYALVATLLLPFVAIRLVSAEKTSGALSLLVQSDASVPSMLLIKLCVLLGAWVVSWIPGAAALALWRSYGGHLHAAETMAVLLGHLVHGGIVILVAFAAAAIAENASSAAVIALGVSLAAWALDFVASVQGGVVAQVARFTPEAVLRTHEQGELDARVLAAVAAAAIALFFLSALFLRPGRRVGWRARRAVITAVGLTAAAVLLWRIPQRHTSADLSEDRRNSLEAADAAALSRLSGALHVEAKLGPQDPRLVDLQRNVLHKIAREMHVTFRSTALTSTGMFESPGEGYGEVWYEWNGRRQMTRSTTVPIVLETIYGLTGTHASAPRDSATYSGYPLVAAPRGAAILFYVVWPLLVLGTWMTIRRAPSRAISHSA